jgi:hypothetical protein
LDIVAEWLLYPNPKELTIEIALLTLPILPELILRITSDSANNIQNDTQRFPRISVALSKLIPLLPQIFTKFILDYFRRRQSILQPLETISFSDSTIPQDHVQTQSDFLYSSLFTNARELHPH